MTRWSLLDIAIDAAEVWRFSPVSITAVPVWPKVNSKPCASEKEMDGAPSLTALLSAFSPLCP
jgi:hypothetical protein